MAISLAGAVNAPGSGAATTSFSTNVPAGVLNNDLLLWTLHGNTVTSAATPTGWTPWTLNTATGVNQSTFYRWASGEPASYTATLSSNRWGGSMLALRGVDMTTPQDVTFPAAINGTTAITFPAITPVTAGAWILAAASLIGPTGVVDYTFGLGNLAALDCDAGTDNAGTTNTFICIGHQLWTSGAFTPTGPALSAQATTRTIGATWALRPAPAAAPAFEGWGVPIA